jgi:hypothetical protein
MSENTNPFDRALRRGQDDRKEVSKWVNDARDKIVKMWAAEFVRIYQDTIERAILTESTRGNEKASVDLVAIKSPKPHLDKHIQSKWKSIDPKAKGELTWPPDDWKSSSTQSRTPLRREMFTIKHKINGIFLQTEVTLRMLLEAVEQSFYGQVSCSFELERDSRLPSRFHLRWDEKQKEEEEEEEEEEYEEEW